MIPQRVKLSGFLSYKDEQEIRFDESPLWMLSGTNGSGKSSIFDAVTFALFGHHRGGSQSALELINKESNTLAVEFDFTIEKQLFRIQRTARRQKNDKVASTQQVMKFVGSTPPPNPLPEAERGNKQSPPSLAGKGDGGLGSSDDSWEPIPDSNYKAKFDAWVKEKIGLDYETFTSSVLLLQGKSEKLLDSTPAGRAGVLARIVDLERYQKLHGKADDNRRELKGQLEGIANQLSGLREVIDEELSAASLRIEQVETLRGDLTKRIDTLVSLELQSRRWDESRKKLATAKEKLAHAEVVLGAAVAIEKEYDRLQELKAVLPAVGVIVTERGRVGESERKTERLTREREEKADARRVTDNALDQVRKKVIALKKTLAEDEIKRDKLAARLQELRGIVEQVKQAEEAETDVKRLEGELKPLPTDPETSVRKFQSEQERLTLLAQHIALLERLHQDRSELTKVVAGESQAKKEETRLLAEGKKAKDDFTALEVKAKQAREDRAKADQEVASARALAQHAKQLADQFKELTGEKTCRACGQPLTPQHFDDEKKKRDLDAKAADRKLQDLIASAAKLRKLDAELTRQEADDREHLAKMRDQYKDAAAAVKQAAQDIKRLTESCRQTYFALPTEFKDKLGPREPEDWSKATYPDRHDLVTLSDEAKQVDAVKRKLRAAQDDAKKVGELKAKLESARERLEKAKRSLPPGDPAAVRQEFADKQSDEKAVSQSLAATKKAIHSAELDAEKTQRDLSNIDLNLTTLTGNLETEEQSRRQSAEAIDRAKKSLPAAWQKPAETAGLNDRAKWQDELDALATSGTEKKFNTLQAARAGLDPLRAEVKQCEDEADSFPEESRRNPEEVKGEVLAARKELDLRNKELLDAQRAKGILDDYREQRRELGTRHKAVDLEHNRYKTLAELLGRDRLQRFLVRTAEKQIVDYANAVLDRLSGGQLFLRLVGTDDGSTEKALELECANRTAGSSAINVAFLSGSQRFRVAVALALGIGQYASKQHRPIESVIIDEGFGCLDRAGRQVMIQELQNLRGHLHCILLVSHQEEFAEAFPDGYRFELHDGATKVSRFVR